MPPTILFLDIDGVLVLNGRTFNPFAMANLARLVKTLNAKVVLTTTWRLTPMLRAQLVKELAAIGICPVGDTPDLRYPAHLGRNRADEIRQWMREFGPCVPVVLDDQDDADIGEGFWLVNPANGLDGEMTGRVLVHHQAATRGIQQGS